MASVHEIAGVDRGKLVGVPFRLIRMDLLEPDAESHLLDEAKPEAVIHTAAIADIDACEADSEGARRLNAQFPAKLAKACAERGIRLVHISTDAVFDGTKDDAYVEEDPPHALSAYSRTKLEGEQAVLAVNPAAIVARVNFFGWSLSGTRSLSEFFFNNLSVGRHCDGFTDVWFCPMFVGDLADLLIRILETRLSGLYHLVGSESLTKYEFGVQIARQYGFDEALVIPKSVEDSDLKARRSHNLRLSVHKLSTDLGVVIPGVSAGIPQFYTQALQGYPQKMRSYQRG